MPGNYWIKLYIEIVDDPKMATLPDRLWRRVIELFLLAGRMGEDGLLPTTSQLAWLLRIETDDLELDMQQLANTGIIEPVPNGWYIPKFAERQAPVSDAERMKEYRKRIKHEQYEGNIPVTNRNARVTQINRLTESESYTESESESEAAADETTKVNNILILYENSFGKVPPLLMPELVEVAKNNSEGFVTDTWTRCIRNGAKSWSYIAKAMNGKRDKVAADHYRATPEGRQKYGEWES